MKKRYKKLLSTAVVLSIILQGNMVFAQETLNKSDTESKKVNFIYERKNNKDYIEMLIDGKESNKEIKEGKSFNIVKGIDIAVLDSKKSKDLKSDANKLVKEGAEALIYVDGGKIYILNSEEITKKESRKNNEKQSENTKESKSTKVKIEMIYREKNSSNELISLKKSENVSESLTTSDSKKENNDKEDKNNLNNKNDSNNKQESQDKEENKDDNKNEPVFNNDDVIAKTTNELSGNYDIIGKEESNFANLINDALLKKTGADIAMTNAGSILKSIPKGNIKYMDIVESVIFGNTVITKKLTGKQIKDAIETGAEIYPESSSKFLHLGNVTYTINVNNKPGNRISDIKVKGKKIDESKQYVVAMNDYMATDYGSISGSSTEKNYGELDKAIAEYVKSKGTINYKNDGRIKINKKLSINREKVKKVVLAIDKLTYDKTSSNIKAVNNAIKMFNELNQDERKQVTNYKKLIKIADHLRKDGVSVGKPNSSTSNTSGNSGSSSNTQKSPKTGDASSIVGAMGTFAFAAAGLGILRRKK